jgi:hypothetical protein
MTQGHIPTAERPHEQPDVVAFSCAGVGDLYSGFDIVRALTRFRLASGSSRGLSENNLRAKRRGGAMARIVASALLGVAQNLVRLGKPYEVLAVPGFGVIWMVPVSEQPVNVRNNIRVGIGAQLHYFITIQRVQIARAALGCTQLKSRIPVSMFPRQAHGDHDGLFVVPRV